MGTPDICAILKAAPDLRKNRIAYTMKIYFSQGKKNEDAMYLKRRARNFDRRRLGTFLGGFDTTSVNATLPLIQSSFHTSIAGVEWVVVAYLLTLSATKLTFGRIADIYGLKKINVIAMAGFTVTSLLCGLSANISALIAFRAVEGLSAAMMMATNSALITNAVSPADRGKGLSASAIAVAVSACAGPSVGGLLATAFGWQSIFLVKVPVGYHSSCHSHHSKRYAGIRRKV